MKWERIVFLKKKLSINIKHTAHPHDMVHVPAKFRENTSMRFRVTVQKLNVTNGQTDRQTDRGHCNISHPGPSVRDKNVGCDINSHLWQSSLLTAPHTVTHYIITWPFPPPPPPSTSYYHTLHIYMALPPTTTTQHLILSHITYLHGPSPPPPPPSTSYCHTLHNYMALPPTTTTQHLMALPPPPPTTTQHLILSHITYLHGPSPHHHHPAPHTITHYIFTWPFPPPPPPSTSYYHTLHNYMALPPTTITQHLILSHITYLHGPSHHHHHPPPHTVTHYISTWCFPHTTHHLINTVTHYIFTWV